MSETPNPSEGPLDQKGQEEIEELVRLNGLMREYDPKFFFESGRVRVGSREDSFIVKVHLPEHHMTLDRECVGSDVEKVQIALIKEMIAWLAKNGFNV